MPKTQSKKRIVQILTIATLVLVPLILCLSGATLYLEFKHTKDMDARVLNSYEIRSQIQHVFSLLQDAETGYRGYIITGEDRYLEPYRKAVSKIDLQLGRFSELLHDRPDQLKNFKKLELLTRARTEALGNGIASRRVGGPEAGYRAVLSGVGKAIMDEARVTIDQMMEQEVAALAAYKKLKHARTKRTHFLVAALFATLIALVGANALLIWRYLTTRESLLAEIRATVARQQAIFDGAIDGIITLNPSGSVESMNKAAERMFGYSAHDLTRQDISKLMDLGGEQNASFLKRIGASEGALSNGVVRELSARRRDGSIVPVDVALGAMELPTGTHVVALIRDISERRRVEQMKEDFISTVSHELRTPLTSIGGSLALLATGLAGELSDKAARLVAIAQSNSQRLVRLINNVLDIGKIGAGEFLMNLEPLELREIARRSIDSMQAYADNYGVSLVLADGPSVPVRGDVDRLIQVTTNLLANACKFSPNGASVRVSVSRCGHLARFSVKDRGPGVPEEFRARIFSKFSQAEGNSQAKGGTGLGLVIAREITDLHGGRLWFESKTGQGATFHLDLPLWAKAEVQDTFRLLVCEDDQENVLAISAILNGGGFSVDVASTAAEALEMSRSCSYDVGLIDVTLRAADSIRLIQDLRASPSTRDLPLIVMSATTGSDRIEGRPIVVIDWLDKPLNPERLRAAVAACLSGSSHWPLVLHVDDDPDLLQVTASALSGAAQIVSAENLQAARSALARQRPDLVILDLGLADGSGPDLLPELTDKMGRSIPVIIYSAPETNSDLVHRVEAVLIKSRTSLELLTKTVHRLIADKSRRHAAA